MPASYVVKVQDSRPADGDIPSASPVYRLVGYAKAFPTIDHSNTLFELFERSVQKYGDYPCLGQRDFVNNNGKFMFESYKEVHKKVSHIASGLQNAGILPDQKIGIYGVNCPEWMIAMQACNRMSYVCVPLYDTLGENAIEFVINHSETSAVFASGAKLANVAKVFDKVKDILRVVVYWGEADSASIQKARDLGLSVYSFDELLKNGETNPQSPVPPTPEKLCTIMYTSGTTGDQKGVMLRHHAVVGTVATSVAFMTEHKADVKPGDFMLSYLPLAHIFDRQVEETWLYFGGGIGYYQGDTNKLVDDIQELKPVVLMGVPRVFDRIYSRIMTGLATVGFIKRLLFTWGLQRKLRFLRQGRPQSRASPIFDFLIFRKVAERFGGKIRMIVSGGAPLSLHVEEFLRAAMCCQVVQGYGLTETCAASFATIPDVWDHVATVGPPFGGTEYRLESVPEMGYDALAETAQGEILVRGTGIFSGYFKDPVKTAEVLEKDGWFHSGDIGQIMPDGAMKIIDRKKNIFKLSQGEYVAVEKVENVLSQALRVEQIWVYGNSFKNSLVAVVVPVEDAVKKYAASQGISGSFEELCQKKEVVSFIMEELKATGKEGKLKGFEMVKAVYLDHNQFSVDEGLMTPTFKLKRPQLQKKYQTIIDQMYTSLKE